MAEPARSTDSELTKSIGTDEGASSRLGDACGCHRGEKSGHSPGPPVTVELHSQPSSPPFRKHSDVPDAGHYHILHSGGDALAAVAPSALDRPGDGFSACAGVSAGGCIAWQVWWIIPYTSLWSSEVKPNDPGSSSPCIRVMTSNVLGPNRNADALLALVRQRKPDVLVRLPSGAGVRASFPQSAFHFECDREAAVDWIGSLSVVRGAVSGTRARG